MPIKNPDHRRNAAAEWRKRNPGYARQYYLRTAAVPPWERVTREERNTKAREYERRCRAERTEEEQAEHLVQTRAAGRRYRERLSRSATLWLARAVRTAKMRALSRGLSFDISAADLLVPAICPVLGIPISIAKGTPTANRPSLDRMDNTKGYVKGNVAVISWRANTRKNDLSLKEARSIVAYMEMAEMLT